MRNEELRKIRGINVMDYLNEHEPGTMIEDGANEWQHRYHSSLKFSAGMFHWFSRGIGGRSALDYLMKVEDMDFRDAVNHLCACYPQLGIAPIEKVPEKPVMKLPKPNEDNDTAVTYLEGRGISRSVIDTCIEKKMLYENVRFHSVIFVGFDEKGRAAYGMYRSTDDSNRRLGELMGSNKKYSFRLTHSPMREIHLFESAIDLLSYATLLEIDDGPGAGLVPMVVQLHAHEADGGGDAAVQVEGLHAALLEQQLRQLLEPKADAVARLAAVRHDDHVVARLHHADGAAGVPLGGLGGAGGDLSLHDEVGSPGEGEHVLSAALPDGEGVHGLAVNDFEGHGVRIIGHTVGGLCLAEYPAVPD